MKFTWTKKFFSLNRDGRKFVSDGDGNIDVPYEYKDLIMSYGFVMVEEDDFIGKRKAPNLWPLIIESNATPDAVTLEVEGLVIDKPEKKWKSPKKKSASAKKPTKKAKK